LTSHAAPTSLLQHVDDTAAEISKTRGADSYPRLPRKGSYPKATGTQASMIRAVKFSHKSPDDEMEVKMWTEVEKE
jgi:hypothetical protein